MSPPSKAFTLCADVRHRTVGDEGVVLRQEAAEVLVVNDIGARIVELLSDGKNVEELVDLLMTEYSVNRATLCKDVPDFLAELTACGVIAPVASRGV